MQLTQKLYEHFQQDSATTHAVEHFMGTLNSVFSEGLWGCLKGTVYHTNPHTAENSESI